MTQKWIHCESHGTAHRLNEDGSCWCTAAWDPKRKEMRLGATELVAVSEDAARRECVQRGLWLFLYDPRKYQ